MLRTLTKQLRIFNVSDLHLEYYVDHHVLYHRLHPILPHADVLVLAGDVGYPNKEYKSLLNKFKLKYKHVVLVPGNHEYYVTENFNRQAVWNQLQDICTSESCHLLNNSSIELEGVNFLGTTLWSRISPKYECIAMETFKSFAKIFLSLQVANKEFQQSVDWLKQELQTSTNDRQVVISHHVPSYSLQHWKYATNTSRYKELIDSLFYSEILDVFNLSKVKYWFCGHSHEYNVMTHKSTQIILNPYGTPQEQGTKQTPLSTNVHWI